MTCNASGATSRANREGQDLGPVSSAVVSALAWIGRYGTLGFALSIFCGLALPQFAAAARPLLPITIFMFVALTFARADMGALRAALARPKAVIIGVVWLLLAPIIVTSAFLALAPRDWLDPGLALGLAIVAASPPVMSGPAIAMMLNLEPTVLMAATIITTLLTPLIGPPIADWVSGGHAPIDTSVLALRLLGLFGGALVFAFVLRRLIDRAAMARHKLSFDGFGVVMYFLFAIAAMDGVTKAALERPATVALYLAIAFGIVLSGMVLAHLVLRLFLPASDCFLLGYSTGQRNMGAMIAAMGAATPESTFLFFALAQFPIYLSPLLLKPFAKRFAIPPGTIPPGSHLPS